MHFVKHQCTVHEPALYRSSAIWYVKQCHGDAIEICDRIIFDYYTGLTRIHSNKHNTTKLLYLFVHEAQ